MWVSPHDRPLATDELHAAVAGADGVVTLLHDRVDDAFLDAAGSGLRIVANAAVGYDNVDVPACARRGVVVSNTPGVLTEATADIAFALILMATRRLGEGRAAHPVGHAVVVEHVLHARLGDPGQDARDRRAREDRPRDGAAGPGVRDGDRICGPAAGARRCRDRARGALPSARRASGAGRRRLAPLPAQRRDAPPDRCRSPRADEAVGVSRQHDARPGRRRGRARRRASRRARSPAAGLDVFEREPEVHQALLDLENVVLIPHLGSATVETRTAMGVLAARNVVAVLGGGEAVTPVA